MIDAIIKEVCQSDFTKGSYPMLSDKYKPFLINKKKFNIIESFKSKRAMVFLDGGNATIFQTPSMALHIIRLANATFRNNERAGNYKEEFYALTRVFEEKEKFYYRTKIFSEKEGRVCEEDLVFDIFDKNLSATGRLDISRVGAIARRLAEIRFASGIAETLEDGDVIVMDGTLESALPPEQKYLDELYRKCFEKNILVSALAKTTNLLTDKGGTFAMALDDLAPEESWYYHPVAECSAESHKADIYFVKLHRYSDYIFRFEIYREQKEMDVSPVLGMLAANSNDISFPGYPYGLVLADRLARVSNRDCERIRAVFLAKAGQEWASIKRHIASDAHKVLDSI